MQPILANAAIPVFFPQPLFMLVVLVPVCAIEAFVLRRSFPVSYGQVFNANLISTLCGIPIAYLSIIIFDILLMRDDRSWWSVGLTSRVISHDLHHWWILPSAMFAVLIPCFLLSIYLEGLYLRPRVTSISGKTLWFAVTKANCYSYLALLAIDCLWFKAKIS
jgi:hypothetical protein